MKNVNIIILIFICLSCTTCKKENNVPYIPIVISEYLTRNIDTARILMQGSWDWVETKKASYRTGEFIYTTPKTEGYAFSYLFFNNIIKTYKNNIEEGIVNFDFKFRGEITGNSNDSLPVLVYYNTPIKYIPYQVSQNYLILEGQNTPSNSGQSIYKKNN